MVYWNLNFKHTNRIIDYKNADRKKNYITQTRSKQKAQRKKKVKTEKMSHIS